MTLVNAKPKILFTHSYFYKLDPKQWEFKQPYPPYNTILAAAYLRQHGFEVSLFDCNLSDSPVEIKPYLEKVRPDFVVLYDDSFNYLSKMCLTNMREACFEMINYSKQYGAKVLVNSSDATDHHEQYLFNGADLVMLGEAEHTLLEILNTATKDWYKVDGIALIKENQIHRSSRRSPSNNLDQFPLPAWDLVDIERYKQVWERKHGFFSLNIATTRGCPFKCNWCAKPIYGNKYNSRSAEDVVSEINQLMGNFKTTHFWICDDIFGLKPGWVKTFSNGLKKIGLKPKLKIQCRADLLLKDETIQNLVEAGLDEVWMGAESGSQQVLDAMEKGTSIHQIYEASSLLKKHGVKVCLFIQYGYLGETIEDIELTLKMIKEIMPDDIGISVSYPLPGTGFYEKVKQQLKDKKNWEHSNDLEMMYEGTYSKTFYRTLYRYTHLMFRKHKALIQLKNPTAPLVWFKAFAKMPVQLALNWRHERTLKKLMKSEKLV